MGNDPVNYTDPTGHVAVEAGSGIDAGGNGGGRLPDRASGNIQDRLRQVQSFFAKYGGKCGYDNSYGCGGAVVDFTQWEIDSGRLEKSAYWNHVNGQMVQDMLDAQFAFENGEGFRNAWSSFIKDPNPGTFWNAHSMSLAWAHGSGVAVRLLRQESTGEQNFVNNLVIPAALSAGPTTKNLHGPGWFWDPSSTGVKWWVDNVYTRWYPYKG